MLVSVRTPELRCSYPMTPLRCPHSAASNPDVLCIRSERAMHSASFPVGSSLVLVWVNQLKMTFMGHLKGLLTKNNEEKKVRKPEAFPWSDNRGTNSRLTSALEPPPLAVSGALPCQHVKLWLWACGYQRMTHFSALSQFRGS